MSSRLAVIVASCLIPTTAWAQGGPCVVPDDTTGTVSLPPEGCAYLSAEEVHMIIDGLPKGTTIELAPIHRDFICKSNPGPHCGTPGGNLGGEEEAFVSSLTFQMTGTGELDGFSRTVSLSVFCVTNTGPRNPGDAVQDFRTEMVQLQGGLFGDPDFDQLNVVGGSVFGLPSPGHTTLTRLGPPGSDFQVDSFFDIAYQIDFVGAPGSVLEGLGGSTVGTVHVNAIGSPGGECQPDPASGTCAGACADATQQCVPICVRFDPATGLSEVIACECRGPDECRIDLPGPPGGGKASGPGGNPCVVTDVGGTVVLPPAGCAYLSPDEVHMILNDLPPDTTIELAPIHQDFICKQGPAGGFPGCPPPGLCEEPGGDLGGNVDCFFSQLQLQVTGTGDLDGFIRTLSVPINCQVHTGPRNPGDPVQDFDTDFKFLQGELFGDPDFCLLRVTGGTGFGLPSPGHTTLTQLPSGNWHVDSFFDVEYQIEFQGCPGSVLDGLSGVTTATIRMTTGGAPRCVGVCPAGTVCRETQIVTPDGFIEICCECVPEEPTEACCFSDGTCADLPRSQCVAQGGMPQGPGTLCDSDGDGVDDACDGGNQGACCFDADGDGLPETCQVMGGNQCAAIGGSFEGPGTVCQGVGACCFGIIGGGCVEVDGICCDNFMGAFQGVGTVCLGDGNGDGADDACVPVECGPRPDGLGCLPAICDVAGHECLPVCVEFDPVTGVTTVLECECKSADECHVVVFPVPGGAASGGPNPCVVPDNGNGTVTLPPPGCEYLSPDEVHMIIEGLPPDTTIELEPIHRDFICKVQGVPGCPPPGQCEMPGGNLGGQVDCFLSTLELNVRGTGDLDGFIRTLFVPMQCQVHTGPRTPGAAVQSFDTDFAFMNGQLFGDPDFCMLRVTGGSSLGLPSPGHTTLTRLPSGDFIVDSFFDVEYRIEFQGCPGSVLEGLSGVTEATIRMSTGAAPRCEGGCPPGQICSQTTTVNADGTLSTCCNCIECIGDTNGDAVVNVDDLVNVILGWGPCPAPCPPCEADVNGDCIVNVDDLVEVILNWGPCV